MTTAEGFASVLSGVTKDAVAWSILVRVDEVPQGLSTFVRCVDGGESATMGFSGPISLAGEIADFWTGRAGFTPELALVRVDADRISRAVASSTTGERHEVAMSEGFPQWGVRFGFVAATDPISEIELLDSKGNVVTVLRSVVTKGFRIEGEDGGGWRMSGG